MNWPFMLRSTHERELEEQAFKMAVPLPGAPGPGFVPSSSDENTGKRALAEALAAKLFAESRAQCALVREEAAEAQLRQLAGPVIEVAQRATELTVLTHESGSAVVRLVIPRGIMPMFANHEGVLRFTVYELVKGAVHMLRQTPLPGAPGPGSVPGSAGQTGAERKP